MKRLLLKNRDSIFGGKSIPPPVKASPLPVCFRRPVSLRDASSASRAKSALKSEKSKKMFAVLREEHEKRKSRPSSFVQDRGPVLGKSRRAVPARCAQVLRSDASRPGSWLRSKGERDEKRARESLVSLVFTRP